MCIFLRVSGVPPTPTHISNPWIQIHRIRKVNVVTTLPAKWTVKARGKNNKLPPVLYSKNPDVIVRLCWNKNISFDWRGDFFEIFHISCFVFLILGRELERGAFSLFGLDVGYIYIISYLCLFVHVSNQWNTGYECKVKQEFSWWVIRHLHFGYMPGKTPLSDTVCSSVRQLWKLPSSLGLKSLYNLPPSFNLIECHCRKKTPAAGCCARCKGTTSAFLGVNWILTTLPSSNIFR